MGLGVFGGAFDPVHNGHLFVAEAVREACGLARVLFVPTRHGHHRSAPLAAPRSSRRHGPAWRLRPTPRSRSTTAIWPTDATGFTADLLPRLAARYPGEELTFIVGGDSLVRSRWERLEAILDQLRRIRHRTARRRHANGTRRRAGRSRSAAAREDPLPRFAAGRRIGNARSARASPNAAASATSFPNRSFATSKRTSCTDDLRASIGGVPARGLVELYGTPLVVIDTGELELEIERFVQAFVSRGIAVGYAGKALLVTALAELLAATPLRLDVCSLGELITGERGGFPAGRIYFHGVAKTDAELAAIAAGRVAFGVIDNAEEIERLALVARASAPVDVMLRINTGIEAHTHEFIRTGGENTKFGIPEREADAAIRRIAALPQLRLIGLHSHVGSQIVDVEPLVANLEALIPFAEGARALGLPVAELNVGGGIGIENAPGEPRPIDLDAFAQRLAAGVAGTPYRLAIEPGRALIARAGSLLYRVVAVKRQGARRFVVVDGGMTDNPRPLLYGAHHPAELIASAATADPAPATLAGRSCENDEIGEYSLPADVRSGDVIAMRYTGAYTFSMASNYNRFGKPAVVFVRDGTHRRVVRAESDADVVALRPRLIRGRSEHFLQHCLRGAGIAD